MEACFQTTGLYLVNTITCLNVGGSGGEMQGGGGNNFRWQLQAS